MKKKILSIVLTIAILMANFTAVSVFSAVANDVADNSQQIEYKGGWNPPEYETEGVLYNDRIAVSKTVAPTENENYFDITFKVVAKQRVIDQSVDVVVVMDNSNTMNATHQNIYPGTAGYNEKDARLTHAKKAINLFVDKYSTDQRISQQRRFGLVTFNSYANTVVPLTTLNSTEQATTIKDTVNGITAPTGNRVRFTNIEGGLQLAENLLKNSDAVYKYIIFLTDGFPTTYIESGRESTEQIIGYDTYMKGAYDADKINNDGYFADSLTGKLPLYGTSYSDKGADRADDVAEIIKNSGVNIFSIGIDVGVQTIPEYLKQTEKANYTVVDRRSENYVIGTTKESYQYWLSHSIAGGVLIDDAEKTETIHRYAEGNSEAQLETAFANILKDIELIPSETMQQAYTIDPMSDYVEFMNFYDLQGRETDKIVNTRVGTDVATFDADKKEIRWNLTNTQSYYVDENTGNYVLYITYKVRLKNEENGFIPSKAFDTNDKTTFYFKTIDLESGAPLYGDNSLDYPIPQVEGYLGSFEFTKQDSITGDPLAGAEFTLQHYTGSCYVCNGDAQIADVTATSNEEGKVVFSNIPSGHEYLLIETKAPEGYQPGHNHMVQIAYGKTYFKGEEVTDSAPAVVLNQKIKPVAVSLTAQKTLLDRTLKKGEFTFVLEGDGHHGVKLHEKETNEENGQVVFKEILFDKVGTYNFKLYEEKGTDLSVLYDDKVYDIQFIVTLNENETEYVLQTKINGEDVENDTAPSPLKFENTLRKSAQVTIEAKKYLDGETPQGTFTFELHDEQGKLLQTKHNVGSDVTFDPIEYTEEGVYKYSVIEGHECAGHDENTDSHHIFFDHSIYNVVVTVTAPEDGDSYIAKVEYYLSGMRNLVEEIVFENHTRKEATLKLKALKTLDGKAPENEKFTFELRDVNGEVVQRVTNDENGVIEFEKLTFNKVGYNQFTVNEVKGDKENIIYDELIYTVNVLVEALHINPDYYLEVTVVKEGIDEAIVLHGNTLELDARDFILFENKTKEPTSESTQPTSENSQPTSDSTEPTSENSQPTSESTEPTSENTEPTENSEPTTESTEPTDSSDPEDENTYPPIDESNSVTEPTDSDTEDVENPEDKAEPTTSAEDETDSSNPEKSPQTGDNSQLMLWIGLLLFSTGMIVWFIRFRKNKESR